MTMTIDTNQQRFAPLNLGHMSSYSAQPQFSNPWASSSQHPAPAPQSASHDIYDTNSGPGSLPHLGYSNLAKHAPHHGSRGSGAGGASMASYNSIPLTSASAGSPLMADHQGHHNLLDIPQDPLSLNRLHTPSSAAYGDPAYTSTASPVNSAAYTSAGPAFDQLGYAAAPVRGTYPIAAPDPDPSRRFSQSAMQQEDRRGFQDALEASHGMLSMSQETPRNIYDVRNRTGRASADSYGFPAAHSTNSSISSTGLSGYYGGSVDSSVSDYSTAGSDIESLSGRTLPRPQSLMTSQAPPAPQSMMSQFSSKISSSTQKKHKCKVCDKRFTRPSSLQTHMYSHTGEKPFACDVEGCGRQFSVVSNLRRHRKVHKNQGQGETPSEAGSEDHHSE
ncbi:hypothetical protein VTK73DRAFT_9395 [Phialemonium thermophilum]|uniref:C2H2-type domain-containing protein n=1 Tax=Phialemonium thermophilum TaxID=223376 RepID=A0ABR3XKU7_9PEZI